MVIDQGVAASRRDFTPGVPLDNCTTYFWRIVPIGEDGQPDPASDSRSFLTKTTRSC